MSAPLQLLDPAARPVIVAYLAEVEAGLPCGRSARAGILAEVADGLVDAVQAQSNNGAAPAAAARVAVAGFGDPQVLAAALAGELAGLAAHRVGLALVATGPVVGAVWVAAYAARSGPRFRTDRPRRRGGVARNAYLPSPPTHQETTEVMPAAT